MKGRKINNEFEGPVSLLLSIVFVILIVTIFDTVGVIVHELVGTSIFKITVIEILTFIMGMLVDLSIAFKRLNK